MAETSVSSWKRSTDERTVVRTGAERLFTFPWPGPGNSEGPVDPDRWLVQPAADSLASGSDTSMTASPSPGPL